MTFTLQNERRPCYVDEKRAFFHKWIDNTPFLCSALVEFENGAVEIVTYKKIIFADGGEFENTAFAPLVVIDND